jgi:hypothetical protein
MAVDLAELRAIIDGDPALASLGGQGDTTEIARLLNETAAGVSIDVPTVSREEVIKAVVPSEYLDAGVTDAQRLAWQMLVTLEEIPVRDSNVRAFVAAIWAGGTTTRANLQALQSREAFRSEKLGASSEYGDRVTHQQVGQALAL